MQSDRLLDEILSLSRSICDFAKAGDWLAGAAQEQTRRDLIKRCFAADMHFADAVSAQSKIQEILRIDRQTLALGQDQREQFYASIVELRQGRAAMKAYRRTQR
jgi:hypothetical protein